MGSLKQIFTAFFLSVSLFILVAQPVLAQQEKTNPAPPRQEYTKGGLVPCGHNAQDPCRVQDLFVLVAKVTNWLLAMAGVYATYVIIGSGFWLIVSQGNEEAISKNKKSISNAIIGLMLCFLSFLFVNTAVNYILHSKCKLDLADPLSYLTIKDYSNTDPNTGKCQ